MDHFMWIASIILLSNSALGNPIPENPPSYSDFFSENAPAENTFAFNDVETSKIPSDTTTQTLDFMNPTLSQPLEEDTQLLTDPLDIFFETAPFSESPDELSANSCKTADRDDLQLYFKRKRNDGEICPTPAQTDPLPLLKLPDLDTLEKKTGSEQGEPKKLPSFIIPPIPGYTVEDDKICSRPWRRLCCQGPVYSRNMPPGLLLVSDCRGMMNHSRISSSLAPFLFIF